MSLPEQERDPQTTYLVYQVLLKDSNSGLGIFEERNMLTPTDKMVLAADLLRSLTDSGSEGHIYTSAAIAAASLSQERRQALESIQHLIEKMPGRNENVQPNFSLYR
jgi:hypothetical protein